MKLVSSNTKIASASVDDLHTVQLTLEQIKLCLIALDVVNSLGADPANREVIESHVKRSCLGTCFVFDAARLAHGRSCDCDDELGRVHDILFGIYYNKREDYYEDVSPDKRPHQHFDSEFPQVLKMRVG